MYVLRQLPASGIHTEVPEVDCEKLSRILKLARTIADLTGSDDGIIQT
jgi:predicted ATPase with chaperone activity